MHDKLDKQDNILKIQKDRMADLNRKVMDKLDKDSDLSGVIQQQAELINQ